jgi:hypothetical protein
MFTVCLTLIGCRKVCHLWMWVPFFWSINFHFSNGWRTKRNSRTYWNTRS